jgi:hypothetical protein
VEAIGGAELKRQIDQMNAAVQGSKGSNSSDRQQLSSTARAALRAASGISSAIKLVPEDVLQEHLPALQNLQQQLAAAVPAFAQQRSSARQVNRKDSDRKTKPLYHRGKGGRSSQQQQPQQGLLTPIAAAATAPGSALLKAAAQTEQNRQQQQQQQAGGASGTGEAEQGSSKHKRFARLQPVGRPSTRRRGVRNMGLVRDGKRSYPKRVSRVEPDASSRPVKRSRGK